MTSRLALFVLMILPLAACSGANLPGLGMGKPQVEGHKGPPGVSPLEQPIETGAEARPVSTAEANTYNTAAFSARGNEPFWAVDVAGSTAIYKTPDNPSGRPVRVSRLNFAQGVEYVGVQAGRPFVVNIRATECRDSMSGQDFPFMARLTVQGRTEAGCAGPATPDVATAVAATRAPVPPAPRAATAATRPTATRPAAPAPKPASDVSPSPAPTPQEEATPSQQLAEPASNQVPPESEGTTDLPTPPAAETPASPIPPLLPLGPARPTEPAAADTANPPAE